MTATAGQVSRGAWVDRLLVGLNVVVLVAALWLVLRPNGVVRTTIGDWRLERQRRVILKAEWQDLAGGSSRMGAGKVGVVEFSDYQCPYCRLYQATIDSVAGPETSLTVGVRHFPLPTHPYATGAALAAICAEAQGVFPAMHRYLLGSQDWQRDTSWTETATIVGVPDLEKFRACRASTTAQDRLAEDVKRGRELGVDGTPTFVNQHAVRSGTIAPNDFKALLTGN